MNTTIKKLCILGLAEGFSTMIAKQTKEGDILRKAQTLRKSAGVALRRALEKDNLKVTDRVYRRVEKKISEIYTDGSSVEVIEVLSLIFLGVEDLKVYSRDAGWLAPVTAAAVDFISLYDPNFEDANHEEALRKYERWLCK